MKGAFEPCEVQRLAMLGDREYLFTSLSKQHKPLSLLKHPALFCMVVKNSQALEEYFTHAFVCDTVEESVSINTNRLTTSRNSNWNYSLSNKNGSKSSVVI